MTIQRLSREETVFWDVIGGIYGDVYKVRQELKLIDFLSAETKFIESTCGNSCFTTSEL